MATPSVLSVRGQSTHPPLGPQRLSRRRRFTPYFFIGPALVLLLAFHLLPIAVSLFGSLFDQRIDGSRIFVGLSNYLELLGSGAFWNSLRVTLVFNLLVNP